MEKLFRVIVFAAFVNISFAWNITSRVTAAAVDSSVAGFNSRHEHNTTEELIASCVISPTDIYLHNKVIKILKEQKLSLIEYQMSFANQSDRFDPFYSTTSVAYRLNKWSRVTTAHGQTLLSLAFNYGILSMKTLTIGTMTLPVELREQPRLCFQMASDEEKILLIRDLVMKDMDPAGQVSFVNEERACHEIVEGVDGVANFKDRCYTVDSNTKLVIVDDGEYNFWLNFLYFLLFLIKVSLFFFGPTLFSAIVLSLSSERIPYVVVLKQSLAKSLTICSEQSEKAQKTQYKSCVHISSTKRFPKLNESVKKIQALPGTNFRAQFKQYDIEVDYGRTLTENVVPVGLLETLFETIFRCRIKNSGPFTECCYGNTLSTCSHNDSHKFIWLRCVGLLSNVLLVLLLPLPYYIRLIVFYQCEYEEISYRKQVTADRDLQEKFDPNLIQYFLPTSPLFIAMYLCYFLTTILFGLLGYTKSKNRIKHIVVQSFRDLERQDWVDTLAVFTSNLLWPLKRYGFVGFLVGLIYWPIMLPVTLVVGAVYCLPTIYLTFRMILHARSAIFERLRRSRRKEYQVSLNKDKNIERVIADNFFEENCDCTQTKINISTDEFDVDLELPPETGETTSLKSVIIYYRTIHWKRFFFYFLTTLLCIFLLITAFIIFAEVVGSLVELIVFTIMGVIVNASALLKYVMLVIMVFGYCCDCFNNMAKKYLKLNKAIFAEVKGRIKDLSDVTSLPSTIQENRGFKAQELNEQGKHESPDDIATRRRNHWIINDLVLFVDSQDMPRIPRRLFDDVCQIRVAGVPGPVYRGHLEALQQFLKIVVFICFLFVIVLTFGAVYQVSTTNQLLATMVGGFLPLILKTFLAPPAPDIEIGSVSFKSKMDEIIKNFKQHWPIYDLPFELEDSAEENKDNKKDDESKDVSKDPIKDITKSPDKKEAKDEILLNEKKYFDSLAIQPTSLHYIDYDIPDQPQQEFLVDNNLNQQNQEKAIQDAIVNSQLSRAMSCGVDIAIFMPEIWPDEICSQYTDSPPPLPKIFFHKNDKNIPSSNSLVS